MRRTRGGVVMAKQSRLTEHEVFEMKMNERRELKIGRSVDELWSLKW